MMRKLVFVVLVVLLPFSIVIQQVKNVRQVPYPNVTTLMHLPTDQVMIIGIGVIGGAFSLHALLGGAMWTLAGGASGALVADWWYAQRAQPGFYSHNRPGAAVAAK
jgi:hypothetical protein